LGDWGRVSIDDRWRARGELSMAATGWVKIVMWQILLGKMHSVRRAAVDSFWLYVCFVDVERLGGRCFGVVAGCPVWGAPHEHGGEFCCAGQRGVV